MSNVIQKEGRKNKVSLHTKLDLKKYFDRIITVTLPQRKELFDSLSEKISSFGGELTKYYVKPLDYESDEKFDYVDVPAPKNWHGRNAQSFNYMQCFFNVIQKAKDDNIESLLYMEDDVCILPIFPIMLPLIMDNAPSYWEQINFGPGHHSMVDNMPSKQYKIEFPYLYRSELNFGMQAVAIHSRMYDMLLELKDKPWINENPYIDLDIAHQFHKGNSDYGRRYCYGTFPYLVVETSSISYNEGGYVSRNEYELWRNYL